jgi:hypothetical protein
MILTGEHQRTRRKTSPSATLSTTNLTWTDLGANPALRGEKWTKWEDKPIHSFWKKGNRKITGVLAEMYCSHTYSSD